MALLERVSTLIRANLNDLIDRAENPEKMLKQVIIDMQNQYMQVKTQVAIAIADLHLLDKKKQENHDKHAEWMRKAEMAVDKKQDDLARAALERAMTFQQMAGNFDEQLADQRTQVELLKNALRGLETKISEAQNKVDLLIAQHRRSRVASKAAHANVVATDTSKSATFDRMKHQIQREEAIGQAHREISGEDVDEKFAKMEREEKIEKLLTEIKTRKSLPA